MCTYKRHAVIALIIYLTVFLALGIGLTINYIKRQQTENYEKEQFNTTYFTIVGYDTYASSCDICEPKRSELNYPACWKVSGYYAYAHLTYLAWFNNTLVNYKGTTHSDWCDINEGTILDEIKKKYPLNSEFIAYYDIDDPIKWRKHLPGYQNFEGNKFIITTSMIILGFLMGIHSIFFILWYCKNRDELRTNMNYDQIQ